MRGLCGTLAASSSDLLRLGSINGDECLVPSYFGDSDAPCARWNESKGHRPRSRIGELGCGCRWIDIQLGHDDWGMSWTHAVCAVRVEHSRANICDVGIRAAAVDGAVLACQRDARDRNHCLGGYPSEEVPIGITARTVTS